MNRLNGWKAIAGYLQRDERTAMRWAAERGMPVRRIPGSGRGSVYAIPRELDDWIEANHTPASEGISVIPAAITPAGSAVVSLKPLPWWRRRRVPWD